MRSLTAGYSSLCWRMKFSTSSGMNFHRPFPSSTPNFTAGSLGVRRPEAWSRTQPVLTFSHLATSETLRSLCMRVTYSAMAWFPPLTNSFDEDL